MSNIQKAFEHSAYLHYHTTFEKLLIIQSLPTKKKKTMALTYEAFMEITKSNAYQLYLEVYRKMEEKDKFIQDVVMGLHQKLVSMESKLDQPKSSNAVTFENSFKTEKVRDMTLIPLKSETENLVFGSSIIAKLENDRNIPNNCAIHAYRGSTTKEKVNVLSKYEKRNLKTLILQDGTNSVLKSNETSDELFADYVVELVENTVDKFSPENVVLCEIIPLKNLPQNKDKNVIIDDFNKLLNDYIEDKPLYKVLLLSKMIKQISQSNSIYRDNFHLNYRIGNPWLKNQILAHNSCRHQMECANQTSLIINNDKTGTHLQIDPASTIILHTTTNTDGTTIPTE